MKYSGKYVKIYFNMKITFFSLLTSTFRFKLPVGYRFPGKESKQSVWVEQATTALQGYTRPSHWCHISSYY